MSWINRRGPYFLLLVVWDKALVCAHPLKKNHNLFLFSVKNKNKAAFIQCKNNGV